MKLIVGLGNHGLRYKNTRHNIGFLVVKEISKRLDISIKKRKYRGLLGNGVIERGRVILFMPQTYMNLSGEAVREIVRKKKINPKDILVISDDINLKFGIMRLRKKGSSGGHNGLKSIIECLGRNEFPRLRIGISRSQNPNDLTKFVLTPFDSEEKPLLKAIIKEAAECALMWLKSGPDKAMTMFNK